nr:YihA family ribosome biogenesis GTP-binding protein [Clostridia bacterium]
MLNVQNTTLAVTAGLPEQLVKDALPQAAFSGRSNVGKSSLVNALLRRKKLARVSGEPGKTITINYYKVDGKLYLVDLPGYGYAKRSDAEQRRFARLTDGYLQENEQLKLVVQLIDLKVGPTEDDMMMLDWLVQTDTPFIIVATKADKPNKTDREKMLKYLGQFCDTVIPFSALKGEGRDDVMAAIEKYTLA